MEKPTIKKAIEILEDDGEEGVRVWFTTLPPEERKEVLDQLQKEINLAIEISCRFMEIFQEVVEEILDRMAGPIEAVAEALEIKIE